MYAVITGEKTFTLLPPTDLLYLEEKEYPSMQYRMKGTLDSVTSSTANCINGPLPHTTTLVNRVKAGDLELTRNRCPTESLTWIGTDPDDPNVVRRHPTFRHAHPLRCKIQPGEILYIPGA
jgi:Cupin-like domain